MRTTVTFVLAFLNVVISAAADDELKDGEKQLQDGIVQIQKDLDELFPADAVRIDFEKDPAGAPFALDADIALTYVPLGCTFETSFADSHVGIQSYNVGGRSGGRSAANQEPLYQGVISIRFCKPGDKNTPGTVTTVGFWTSHIAPKGTSLVAYDASGKEIVTVPTSLRQREFLAIRSQTPIAYIAVIPNVDIDPDYAIDDLVFDRPTVLMNMEK